MANRPFFPRSDRLLVGAIVLIIGLSISYIRWSATRGPLETFAWVEQHRGPDDGRVYASALYHASHARAVRDARWSPMGYATQGVIASLVGIALLWSGLPRRSAPRPETA